MEKDIPSTKRDINNMKKKFTGNKPKLKEIELLIQGQFVCAYNKICSDYNQNIIIIKVDYLCIGVWMKVDYLV